MIPYFKTVVINNRPIVIDGVAKIFYQDGLPLSIAIDELKRNGFEVSMLHVVEQLWNVGWSPKTILSKMKDECLLDINNNMQIDWREIETFVNYLEQPLRGEGGYESSRKMIFESLFNRDSAIQFLKQQ